MRTKEIISIIVADDHRLFRNGIIEILKASGNFTIAGEAENGDELVDLYFKKNPDVALIDISMPVMSGIEALQKIRERDPNAKGLFLSMYDSDEYIYAALISGGMGLINKNINKDNLIKSIKSVHNGVKCFKDLSNEQLEALIKKFSNKAPVIKDNFQELSHREKQLLQYISEGMTSAEMAKTMNLSKRTIDTHRTHLIQKLNLRSLPDLIKYAIQYTMINKKQEK